jgi:hypothetical protein
MKSVVFWVITRHRAVIIYRRFGTTCRSHLHGSRFRVGNKASKETWQHSGGGGTCDVRAADRLRRGWVQGHKRR